MKANIPIFTSRRLFIIHELRSIYWQLFYNGSGGFQEANKMAYHEVPHP